MMQELKPAAGTLEITADDFEVFGLKLFQVAMVGAALLVGLLSALLVRPHPLLAFIAGVFTVMAAYEFFPKYPVIILSLVLMLGGFILLLA